MNVYSLPGNELHPPLGDGKFGAAEPTRSLISSFSDESESRSVLSDSLRPHGLCSPWDFPGQNTGVGSLFLLQEIFPAQGLYPGSPILQADSLPAEPQGKSSFSDRIPVSPDCLTSWEKDYLSQPLFLLCALVTTIEPAIWERK